MQEKSGGVAAEVGATACAALRNPIRVRVLEVLDERDISPNQFVQEGLFLPHHRKFESHQNALSHVAYHFRVLERAGCVEVINRIQRRGATEHVYRGIAQAFHSDEDFAQLTFEERQAISRTTLQSLVARADNAIMSGTFDRRADRHLSWVAMDLDEEGWEQVRLLEAETLARAEGIKTEAARRLASAGQEAASRVTVGALAFESPPRAKRT